MSHITQEQPAFEVWFQAVWLGDEEHGQRVPTAISDPLYSKYLEDHQLALGAWMHRAALAQPEPTLKWCGQCGEGVVDFCRAKGEVKCGYGFAKAGAAQPEPVSLTDEQDRALCEAYCNTHSDEYFKARPQLDSDVNRRIFCAGHRKAWITVAAAKGGAL